MIQMDILLVVTPRSISISSSNIGRAGISFNLLSAKSSFTTFCSSKPSQNGDDVVGDDDLNTNHSGRKFSTDWDKAWSSFKNQGKKKNKKSLMSQFSPNKYVSWNPRRSNYPLSEEVDPIKRTERSNLMLWTSPRFTLVGAIVIVSVLLIYTLLAPVK